MEESINKPGYDAFLLKIVAIAGMAMQHSALVLGEVIPVALHFPLQLAGGLTFPIMAFLLVEGYRHTSNVKRYMGRLFLWGVISQVPHTMAFGMPLGFPTFNIMFTLFMSLLAIVLYDRMKRRGLFVFLFVLICLATALCDWGIIGPVVVFIYHTVKTERLRRIVAPVLAASYGLVTAVLIGILVGIVIVFIGIADPAAAEALTETLNTAGTTDVRMGATFAGILFPIGSFLVVPLVLRYNGERGRSLKYMFYAFYPLHLLILALIAYAVGISDLIFFAG